ncbi:DUF6504 family protein [Tessaracoccus defluvii]|uniref:DUF6504 family protein n=1 Tax=Tessaracoccus defluvii TaxID=1285901 RepID=UPI001D04471C|nr:DUF6504 family protein [Tessaracoccus defluvii]
MRTYDEPIHVLFTDQPRQFIWRDRLLLVKEVQGRWNRAAPWWTGPRVRAARGEEIAAAEGDLLGEREIWRVEAGNGRQRGVYELARTVDSEDWVLQAVLD